MSTLAELRQANLREQKEKAAPPDLPEDAAVLEPPIASETPALLPAETSAIPALVEERPEERAPALSLVTEEMQAVSPGEQASEDFLNRVRALQSRKTMYPAGVKVTADMTPALFARAKRYCHEHGNVTLRQVMIDLLAEFLDEENY